LSSIILDSADCFYEFHCLSARFSIYSFSDAFLCCTILDDRFFFRASILFSFLFSVLYDGDLLWFETFPTFTAQVIQARGCLFLLFVLWACFIFCFFLFRSTVIVLIVASVGVVFVFFVVPTL